MSSLTRRTMVRGTLASAMLPIAAASDAAGTALPSDAATPTVEFAFSAHVLLEPTREIGTTPYGIRRRIPIIGGTFEGPRIRGRVLPGGADWQLERTDHYMVLEADYMIETEDGTQIHVHNRGLTNSRVPGAKTRYLRTVPTFEAPAGPHDWLNQSIFVGSVEGQPGTPPAVRVHVFRLA